MSISGASFGALLGSSPAGTPTASARRSLDEPRDAVPGNAAPSGGSRGLHVPAWLIIGAWISLSSTVILYKCVPRSLSEAPQLTRLLLFSREIMMGSAHFHYPLTLTSLHLLFQTVATRLLHRWTDLIAPSAPSSSYALLPLTEPKEDGQEEVQSAAERRVGKAAAVQISWSDWGTLMCVLFCA